MMVRECQQQTQASEMEEKSAPELQEFLEKNVGNIDQGEIQLDQTITYDTDKSSIITYQRFDPQEEEDLQYVVNVADLDERSITFDTKGAFVIVTAEVQGGQDLVQVIENGRHEGYQDDLTFIASDIEQARFAGAGLAAVSSL